MDRRTSPLAQAAAAAAAAKGRGSVARIEKGEKAGCKYTIISLLFKVCTHEDALF